MNRKSRLAAFAAATVVAGIGMAPATAFAEDATTLGDILSNSGITAAGYITTGYTGSFNKGQTLSYRVFDSSANTFNLNQAALVLAHTPTEGFGGKVVLVGGTDAKVLNAFYGSGGSDLALFIAYAQYAHGPLTVIAGRFPALSGAELALEPLNSNISRSLVLALAQPVPLTGARATYALSDKFNASVSISNSDAFGSAAALDDNSQKAIEAGFSFTPTESLKLNVYNYYSKESAANGGKNNIVDVVGSWQATPKLQLVVNGDYKKIFKTTVAGPKGVTKGVAGYVNYQFTPKFGASLRVEHLNLKNDVANTSHNLEEATLTGTYRATSNFRLNAEVRYDRGSVPSFADGFVPGSSTPRLSKHDGEVKVSAVYSFGGI